MARLIQKVVFTVSPELAAYVISQAIIKGKENEVERSL